MVSITLAAELLKAAIVRHRNLILRRIIVLEIQLKAKLILLRILRKSVFKSLKLYLTWNCAYTYIYFYFYSSDSMLLVTPALFIIHLLFLFVSQRKESSWRALTMAEGYLSMDSCTFATAVLLRKLKHKKVLKTMNVLL